MGRFLDLQMPFVATLAAALATVAVAGRSQAASEQDVILRLSTREEVSLSEVVSDLRGARIVFLGEEHNRTSHHRAQLSILEALEREGAKLSIGLEMFRDEAAADLKRWVGGESTEGEFRAVFDRHWNAAWWPFYRDIFLFARQRRIPLVGVNLDVEIVRKIAIEGIASLTPDQAAQAGMAGCEIDPVYAKLIAPMAQQPIPVGKGQWALSTFPRLCEAFMAWNAHMAESIARRAQEHPDQILVVLVGSLHALRQGLPTQLAKRFSLPVRVVLPGSDPGLFSYSVAPEDADYVWWHK